MRNKAFSVTALAGLLLMLLAACEPGSNTGSRSGDGRTRLSVIDSYADFGNHMVHVNGMTTSALTPEVAQSYGIVRSENMGLVNLVVLKKSGLADAGTPVKASVSVSAANLTGQLKNMELREIEDGPSIYYIGEVSIDDRETINFDFDIRPEGSDQTLMVRFSHRFYEQ